ncbi:hypothetical protein BpHYR1_049709 [Brachionus plicatilis]|uniref:Endonuclease-reverse transcriptase n=1 Tax=Brachionus plicatilis TaxID=10195 RepID=A0A3M7QKL5_BRAPC|nr:hypothetical protein BpHYR1_049709 [Brachionus plicatilis]
MLNTRQILAHFIYLGCRVTKDSKSSSEIQRRIGLGAHRFQCLKPIWNKPEISIRTISKIYLATVKETTIYGAESWTCSPSDYQKLINFLIRRLMQIVGPRRIGLTEQKLYSQTKTVSLDKIVRTIRLRWAGHIRRMLDTRLPKIVLFGDVLSGKRGMGRSEREWTDCLKKDCERAGIVWTKWVNESKNREKWLIKISSLTSNT